MFFRGILVGRVYWGKEGGFGCWLLVGVCGEGGEWKGVG